MHDAENTTLCRETVLRVSPDKKSFLVEEHKPGGIIAHKRISPEDLYYAINSSFTSSTFYDSGFLPEHCISVSLSSTEKRIVLWNPSLTADITYGEKEYQNFPIPRLVLSLRVLQNGKVAGCAIATVADEKPSPDTILYHYPFSNVHDTGEVCTGNNVMPKYRNQQSLIHFPRFLLGLPDNDDYYHKSHNKLQLSHRELLEHMKDKEPSYYYTDVLVPSGKTLKDFLTRR